VFPLEWTDPKTGDVSSGYRESDYLPSAVVNFLALLGWNPGTEQEIMSMDELIQLFELSRCNKSGAKFDYEKGRWFNHEYILKMSDEDVAKIYQSYLLKDGIDAPWEKIVTIVNLMKNRVNFIHELIPLCRFFFVAPTEYDAKTTKKRWKENSYFHMSKLLETLEGLDDYSIENQEKVILELIEKNEFHLGQVMNAWRLTLVGEGIGPQMFDIIGLLGHEETIKRMRRALTILPDNRQ
ncbi:MAG: glutamate--tRNA ligase family protein, partial [Bacteroidaceae bacterium]